MRGRCEIIRGHPMAACFLVSLTLAAPNPTRAQSPARAWLPLPDLPIPVRSPAAATDGQRIYVIGGSTAGGRTGVTQILDLASRTWSFGASVPEPTDWGSAAWAGGELHFLGGVTNRAPATAQHFVYRPDGDTWRAAEPLPTQIAGTAVVALATKIYLFAGNSGASPAHTSGTFVFDTRTGAWSAATAVPGARINWAGAAASGRAYLMGGGTPGLRTSADILLFDPTEDAWRSLGSLPRPREAHGVGAAGGLVCALGGRLAASGNFSRPFDDVTCFVDGDRTPVPAPRLPYPRQEVVAVSLDGAIVAIGGADERNTPSGRVSLLRVVPGGS